MAKLAINGGKPVRETMLPYGHHLLDESDIDSAVKVLRGDWITQGEKVQEFEEVVAKYCGAKYAVAVSSGTAALHAACAVAGITKSNAVITTPMTFSATANAILYCGGKPEFVDIREDTLNIDFAKIRIIHPVGSEIKAIIPVDFAGHPADYEEINSIARKNNLIVIEDATHALGAEYKDNKVGRLADMTVFSFHAVKNIVTGEGGMVLTNNKEFYEKLKIFRHHGIIRNPAKGSWYYEIDSLGYNFRITDFQCALGISQLKKLDGFIERRREIATRYNKAFAEMEEIITPFEEDYVKAVYHIYVIQLRLDKLKVGRKEIFEALRAENIGVNVHYIPVHLLAYYKREFGYKEGDYPVAEKYYGRAITLPIFPKMTDGDVGDVVSAVKKVIGYYRE